MFLLMPFAAVGAVSLHRCRIVVDSVEAPLVRKMAGVLADDIERVTGKRMPVADRVGNGNEVVLATVDNIGKSVFDDIVGISDIKGGWERFAIATVGSRLLIVGSDPRGLAYGVLHVSERIGVSPWYWWADVPVARKAVVEYTENYVSESPTVKYRGCFINDEDWGMLPWAAHNHEKDLGDIGPKTYDRVCELILRLKGNMLAPAMHTCTGAFYSHPESQERAAEWGIMITTSHCEPMLLNNASPSEWDRERDGEWNYLTNKATILRKFEQRLRTTSQYDNIYTMGMRGLHDEAMKGADDPAARARTLEQVFADQRRILEHHKGKAAEEVPQIFVPYKETLDIYDAGLRVPDDITLVWPDDNYGYMKRVSSGAELTRKGGSGVYYHLSYLGTPHDYLWLATTPPALMYEELKKAYDAGADRYWLLNVGDIKPMEIEMQQFFDMAWDFNAFSHDNANRCQAQWLSAVFGSRLQPRLQWLLDTYYRLAWERKPEFMGYEMEWDTPENVRLHDTGFSFRNGSAQARLADYEAISCLADSIMHTLPDGLQPAFFQMLGYSIKAACQMNRKFLMAQLNHETGNADAARQSREAHDSINALNIQYNSMLGGKWNNMMSCVPPGFCAKYQGMPELTTTATDAYRLPDGQRRVALSHNIDIADCNAAPPFRVLEGLGIHWKALQMGDAHAPVQNPASMDSDHIDFTFTLDVCSDSLTVSISTLPLWPVSRDRSNRFGVALDGCQPVVCENIFEEWSYEWKLQVLANRKDYLITLPVDRNKRHHTLSLIIGDPGQIIQGISYGVAEE